MTELDAINRMLRYVGELPVPISVVIDDLDDGHEAKIARAILEEANRETQEQGWWFNTEDWTFHPDVGGYITISSLVITLKSLSQQSKYRVDGGDLYSITDQTKIFTTSVELRTIFEVPFSDTPSTFSTLVTYLSSKQLHEYLNADTDIQKSLDNNIYRQTIKVEREHLANKQYNLISGSRVIDRTTNPTALT